MLVSDLTSSFDSDGFREAIRNTMLMGMPNASSERVTFRWTDRKTFSKHDASGRPLNWYATPVSNITNPDVEVPVAIEYSARASQAGNTTVGNFNNPRAVLTLLDVDFALVEGADKVIIDGSEYTVDFVEPPVGLFDVTVYTVHISAIDEH